MIAPRPRSWARTGPSAAACGAQSCAKASTQGAPRGIPGIERVVDIRLDATVSCAPSPRQRACSLGAGLSPRRCRRRPRSPCRSARRPAPRTPSA
jgi:hypothetical protein